jgi:hypothetical protein
MTESGGERQSCVLGSATARARRRRAISRAESSVRDVRTGARPLVTAGSGDPFTGPSSANPRHGSARESAGTAGTDVIRPPLGFEKIPSKSLFYVTESPKPYTTTRSACPADPRFRPLIETTVITQVHLRRSAHSYAQAPRGIPGTGASVVPSSRDAPVPRPEAASPRDRARARLPFPSIGMEPRSNGFFRVSVSWPHRESAN